MFVIERFGLSVLKACKVIDLSRTSFLYKPAVRSDENRKFVMKLKNF